MENPTPEIYKLFEIIGELKGLMTATNAKIDTVIAGAQREIADARKETNDIKCDLEAKDKCWHSKFEQIQQGKDIAHDEIENRIGEVPANRTVMSCLRDVDERVSKIYIVCAVVGTIYVLVSPFLNPLVREIFHFSG